MSASDRYILALALLGGDRAARSVLADLLDEEGEPDLALFARRARHSREGDLDLTLRLLPEREAVLLGCDYLDHLLGLDGGYYRHQWLLAQMSEVRRLVSRGGPGDHLSAAVLKLWYFVSDRQHGPVLDEAVHAMGQSLQALHARAAGEPHECSAGIAVASAARHLRKSSKAWGPPRETKRQRRELEWQIKRAQQVLQELIAAAPLASARAAAPIRYAENEQQKVLA
jgi:hypothetical protein